MKKQTTLKKDLLGCPAGRIFKEDINGDFFHSMTDEEFIEGNLKDYKFTKQEVLGNDFWFTVPEVVELTPVNNMAEFKNLLTVQVPNDSTDYFINNVGCLRYSTNEGKESSCVEPEQMGEYLEKDKHEILGVSDFKTLRIVIIEKK